jgi:hypothetical protein
MDLNIGGELTWARGLTRGKRKLSVTPLRCRDRRLVHRPYGADSPGGDKETSRDEPADCPDLSDHELEELGETYIKKMREEGLPRPTLVRPGEDGPEAEMKSQAGQPDGEASF